MYNYLNNANPTISDNDKPLIRLMTGNPEVGLVKCFHETGTGIDGRLAGSITGDAHPIAGIGMKNASIGKSLTLIYPKPGNRRK